MCDSCNYLYINGIGCHETGCINSWKDKRECKDCGLTFSPDNRWQFKCNECLNPYYESEENYE